MIIETKTPNLYIKDQSLSTEVEEWLKTHKAMQQQMFYQHLLRRMVRLRAMKQSLL